MHCIFNFSGHQRMILQFWRLVVRIVLLKIAWSLWRHLCERHISSVLCRCACIVLHSARCIPKRAIFIITNFLASNTLHLLTNYQPTYSQRVYRSLWWCYEKSDGQTESCYSRVQKVRVILIQWSVVKVISIKQTCSPVTFLKTLMWRFTWSKQKLITYSRW